MSYQDAGVHRNATGLLRLDLRAWRDAPNGLRHSRLDHARPGGSRAPRDHPRTNDPDGHRGLVLLPGSGGDRASRDGCLPGSFRAGPDDPAGVHGDVRPPGRAPTVAADGHSRGRSPIPAVTRSGPRPLAGRGHPAERNEPDDRPDGSHPHRPGPPTACGPVLAWARRTRDRNRGTNDRNRDHSRATNRHGSHGCRHPSHDRNHGVNRRGSRGLRHVPIQGVRHPRDARARPSGLNRSHGTRSRPCRRHLRTRGRAGSRHCRNARFRRHHGHRARHGCHTRRSRYGRNYRPGSNRSRGCYCRPYGRGRSPRRRAAERCLLRPLSPTS
jgi:hypothetical protein